MKILGISNPQFAGVTHATQAVCTTYYATPHIDDLGQARYVADALVKFKPDLLIVGGWSRGYESVLTRIRATSKFPIVHVSHSTVYHGNYFGEDVYTPKIDGCLKGGLLDLVGYASPQQAQYDRRYRGRMSFWMPHAFEYKKPKTESGKFRIGVLGGGYRSPFKNYEGTGTVVREFCEKRGYDAVVPTGPLTRPEFAKVLSSCSLIVHASHLECYSNLIQEAWSYGVPAIVSTACAGLTEGPLLTLDEREYLSRSTLRNTTDPVELYGMLDRAIASNKRDVVFVTELSKELYQRTQKYLWVLFERIVKGYHSKRYDLPSIYTTSSHAAPSVNS